MKGRVRAIAIATGSAVVTVALMTVTTAGLGAAPQQVGDAQPADQAGLPEGPFIDFCPTQEQIEAHLEKYGFDYKPAVVCGEGGVELPSSGEPTEDATLDALFAERKAVLATATRAPDKDGDPLTMEIILADGTRMTIDIFGDPEVVKDTTPADLAELVVEPIDGSSK